MNESDINALMGLATTVFLTGGAMVFVMAENHQAFKRGHEFAMDPTKLLWCLVGFSVGVGYFLHSLLS